MGGCCLFILQYKTIRLNNSSDYKTGYAAIKEPPKDYPEYNEGGATIDKILPYNTITGYLASTSGNIRKC